MLKRTLSYCNETNERHKTRMLSNGISNGVTRELQQTRSLGASRLTDLECEVECWSQLTFPVASGARRVCKARFVHLKVCSLFF